MMLSADGLEYALIGVGRRCGQPNVLVYNYDLCVGEFVKRGMTPDEAIEWMEFNVVGAWVGDETPMFVTECDEEGLKEWMN